MLQKLLGLCQHLQGRQRLDRSGQHQPEELAPLALHDAWDGSGAPNKAGPCNLCIRNLRQAEHTRRAFRKTRRYVQECGDAFALVDLRGFGELRDPLIERLGFHRHSLSELA